MWDGTIITRVRDRKMNEIITYAAMIKVDSTKKSQYVKLIDAISDDIDACEAILSSNGEARPVLGVIDCPEYLSRLSPAERSDEDEFDSYIETLKGMQVEELIKVKQAQYDRFAAAMN